MCDRLELSQVDAQRLDQGLSDLQDNVFQNAVSIDRVAEDCKRQIAQSIPLSGQKISMEAYQEHARVTKHALEQCRSQLTGRERRIKDGESQLRRLQLSSFLVGTVSEWARSQPRIGTQSWPHGCHSWRMASRVSRERWNSFKRIPSRMRDPLSHIS